MERAVLVQSEPYALFVLHGAQVHIDQHAFVLGDQFWRNGSGSDTSQVEGPHRELRSWFPDRLSGDNTDSFP